MKDLLKNFNGREAIIRLSDGDELHGVIGPRSIESEDVYVLKLSARESKYNVAYIACSQIEAVFVKDGA